MNKVVSIEEAALPPLPSVINDDVIFVLRNYSERVIYNLSFRASRNITTDEMSEHLVNIITTTLKKQGFRTSSIAVGWHGDVCFVTINHNGGGVRYTISEKNINQLTLNDLKW